MFVVLIGCSACPEEMEVVVSELDDVDALACECGYGYAILGIGELAEPRGELRVLTGGDERDDDVLAA